MKNILLITTGILASIFINTGCGSSQKITGATTQGSETLYQGEWKLTAVQGSVVPENSRASLAFTPAQVNRITGHTGCNRMNGSFERSGTNRIKFSPLAVTKMACVDNGIGAIENKFLDALAKADSWSISEGQLLLQNGNTVLAKLRAQKTPGKEEQQLNGAWELNYISGPKIAFEGLFPDRKPLIVFDFPKTEVTGNGGCNGYSAQVKVAGNTISFGDALSTLMACEGNGEPVYFKTLKTVTGYHIDGDTLTLLMGDIAVMRFVKK